MLLSMIVVFLNMIQHKHLISLESDENAVLAMLLKIKLLLAVAYGEDFTGCSFVHW